MTEEEDKEAKAMLDRIAEQERKLKVHAQDAEDSFTPVMKGIIDLLAAAKKRISDRIDGERPPQNA